MNCLSWLFAGVTATLAQLFFEVRRSRCGSRE
jgi:hypothetical protein